MGARALKRLANKRFILFGKLAVTVTLCGVVIANVDYRNLLSVLRGSNVSAIAIVCLGTAVNMLIHATRWKVLLRIEGFEFRLLTLVRYYLTGMFFNNFLPSTVGGDGYRMYKIYRASGSKSGAVIPVIGERFFGLMILCCLGFVAGMISYSESSDQLSKFGLLLGLAGTVAFILVIVVLARKKEQPRRTSDTRFARAVRAFVASAGRYRSQKARFVQFIGWTVLFYLIVFGNRFILIRAFGESVSVYPLVIAIMISTIVAMIPISLNGIGLLDGSFIFLISRFGVDYDSAVMVMVIQRALLVGMSLLGAMFYSLDKDVEGIDELDLNVSKIELRS